jgi:hypothetical protein
LIDFRFPPMLFSRAELSGIVNIKSPVESPISRFAPLLTGRGTPAFYDLVEMVIPWGVSRAGAEGGARSTDRNPGPHRVAPPLIRVRVVRRCGGGDVRRSVAQRTA